MFSRILIKLVDQAIFPAIMLLAARVLSVVLVSKYLGLTFEIKSSEVIFLRVADYVKVNSYSVFIMALVLTLGLAFVLLKSFAFHDSHISPGLSAKLFSLSLPSFIQSSFEIYSQGAIWLSYLYLLALVSGLMAVFGLLYVGVFYFTLTVTVISTICLIYDVEHELKISKTKTATYDTDSRYLEQEGE